MTRTPAIVHMVEMDDDPCITTHRSPAHCGVLTISGAVRNPINVLGVQNLVYK